MSTQSKRFDCMKAQRDEARARIKELQSLLTPRRIDEDTPDGVLVWINGSWENAYRSDTGRWVQGSTNLYHDDQPAWWLPMLPAPEDE